MWQASQINRSTYHGRWRSRISHKLQRWGGSLTDDPIIRLEKTKQLWFIYWVWGKNWKWKTINKLQIIAQKHDYDWHHEEGICSLLETSRRILSKWGLYSDRFETVIKVVLFLQNINLSFGWCDAASPSTIHDMCKIKRVRKAENIKVTLRNRYEVVSDLLGSASRICSPEGRLRSNLRQTPTSICSD